MSQPKALKVAMQSGMIMTLDEAAGVRCIKSLLENHARSLFVYSDGVPTHYLR
jgi:hypothetical protein